MTRLFNPTRLATAGFFVLTAAGLGGCGSLTSGTTVAKYTRGEDPGPPVVVNQSGTYALYYTTDATPQVRTPVQEGERVGFESSGGSVTAVAGSYQKVMDKSVYKAYWKHVSDK